MLWKPTDAMKRLKDLLKACKIDRCTTNSRGCKMSCKTGIVPNSNVDNVPSSWVHIPDLYISQIWTLPETGNSIGGVEGAEPAFLACCPAQPPVPTRKTASLYLLREVQESVLTSPHPPCCLPEPHSFDFRSTLWGGGTRNMVGIQPSHSGLLATP